jgi:hypothetical protein
MFDQKLQSLGNINFMEYLLQVCSSMQCSQKNIVLAYIYVERYTQHKNDVLNRHFGNTPHPVFAINTSNCLL